ncbi:hypothetical protein TWF192_001311 [Orbilia oligospora]|uniref:Uncharacterized protein n=1 Tax=Orbilia oligospora TaxID=2813651 RepID=A0A6G1LV34_ORBOL|nr:hypothetical protein TWF191_001161 [Orbilia oligospora]KAF3234447.1 hypothetical protein TWF192_001311 [Orbilia oligospora]
MRSQAIQPKKTRYTLLLFILSTALSLHFLKVPYFSKGFSFLPPVRADDGDLPIPYARRDENQFTHSPPMARSRFDLGGRISLYCYPSDGGYWYATHVSSVELDFLGIDRFKPQDRALNQTEEDAFCKRLQLLEPLYDDGNDDWVYKPPLQADNKHPRIRHIFCWTKTGGAWVKKLTYMREGGWYGPGRLKVTIEGDSSLVGAIWNAYSMEERCQAFERAGGKFCAKPEDCEETKPYIGKKNLARWLEIAIYTIHCFLVRLECHQIIT